MLTIRNNRKKNLYVCESCGCAHTKEDEVFHIGDVELCVDCANLVSIDDPGCHFHCSECYGDCVLFAEAKSCVA